VVACTPHPGLGTVAIQRPAHVQVVDLATCKTTTEKPPREPVPTAKGKTIVFHGKVIVHATQPLVAMGASIGGRWVIYAVDAYNSASLAADGLPFRIVAGAGGASRPLSGGLVYPDYHSWCDFSTLVMTVGASRIAVDNKRLILFHAPSWTGRNLRPQDYRRAFGSVECAPDGNSVVVQEAPQRTDNSPYTPHWQLWRITLAGKATRLTSPPDGYSDDSPHFSPDQSTIYFVRSRGGTGSLYAIHRGKLVGPLLSLGHEGSYFEHTVWPYSVRR
jgi:hypothetical protein